MFGCCALCYCKCFRAGQNLSLIWLGGTGGLGDLQSKAASWFNDIALILDCMAAVQAVHALPVFSL